MFGGTNLSVGRQVILGSRLGCRRACGRRRAFRRARLSFRANTQARADRSLRNWACSEDSVSMRRRPVDPDLVRTVCDRAGEVARRHAPLHMQDRSLGRECRLHALEPGDAFHGLLTKSAAARLRLRPRRRASRAPGAFGSYTGASLRPCRPSIARVSWVEARRRAYLRSERRRHRGGVAEEVSSDMQISSCCHERSASVFAASSRRATSRAR